MAKLTFTSSTTFWKESELDSLYIFGTNKALTSPKISANLNNFDERTYLQLVDKLKPSTELNGQAITHHVVRKDKSDDLQKVVIGATTTFASRHNAPNRPDQLAQLVKDQASKASGKIGVILAIDKPEFAFSSALAVAKCFPLFNKKSSDKKELSVEVGFICADGDNADIDLQSLQLASDSLRYAAKLVDTPTNELTTTAFVNEAKIAAQELGAKITIFMQEELIKQGLGGLVAVGKAAADGPALVILSHVPLNKEEEEAVVLVGKGIVYDTGGLSIKGKDFMPGMKRDMGGAAAVLGAFIAAVKGGTLKVPLHAVLCLAENAVGPLSTRPDDIITLYSGKTVEINNTDAEGRLVLGDGIAYSVKNLRPKVLIDMATLTGAQSMSTGKRHAAIICNEDNLENKAIEAGKVSGELVFPLPYCPEFFKGEFSSEVADMKNSVKDRSNAQASCAAQFIANHLGNYLGPWLHVDMAGPSHNGDRATGYGVGLLLQILKQY